MNDDKVVRKGCAACAQVFADTPRGETLLGDETSLVCVYVCVCVCVCVLVDDHVRRRRRDDMDMWFCMCAQVLDDNVKLQHHRI